jgi:hypothetical protein
MFKIIKTCRIHGCLTINDVYIRNTRKGIDCKFCSKESAQRRKNNDIIKFQQNGLKYRYIEVSELVTSRLCSCCKKETLKDDFTKGAWRLRHPYCRSCMSLATKKSKIKNRDTYEAYKIKTRTASRKSYLKKRWGISLDEFNKMVKFQNGKCAICKINPEILHIDHNHESGKVRSLLCNQCNRGIGYLKESPRIFQAAIKYINYHANN